jgi:hypothetical protein
MTSHIAFFAVRQNELHKTGPKQQVFRFPY